MKRGFDNFKINIKNIYCTKIASKLVRTYTDKHGYKDLCSELLGQSISKTEQSSDWGGELNQDQQKYAATEDKWAPAAHLVIILTRTRFLSVL